jgi:hypothetical protein
MILDSRLCGSDVGECLTFLAKAVKSFSPNLLSVCHFRSWSFAIIVVRICSHRVLEFVIPAKAGIHKKTC